MVRPGVYIINVKHKETLRFFCVKKHYQIAKSNQIKHQIRFLKLTSHQINLIYINLMYRYVHQQNCNTTRNVKQGMEPNSCGGSGA